MHVPNLFLNETFGITKLKQVRDIRVPETVQCELTRQAGLIPQLSESAIEIAGRHLCAPLGYPQRL